MTKYAKIANDIRTKIMSGEYKSNEQLPFEKELCEKYDTSKMTVKKALDILMMEGLIIKRRGAGTFVKDINVEDMQKLVSSNEFRGFTVSHADQVVQTTVLEYNVIVATDEIAQNLKLEEGQFVYKVVRLRCIADEPRVIEETYMPIDVIKGLKKEHLEGSLYEYIEDVLKLKIQSGHRTIEIKKADEVTAKHLKLSEGEPIGVATQIGFLDNGQAFEYSITLHSYKYFKFESVLLR